MSWSIDKYRNHYESEEHWEMRKLFMETHKELLPEDELVCMAQVFFNIEILGCRYPDTTMLKVTAKTSYKNPPPSKNPPDVKTLPPGCCPDQGHCRRVPQTARRTSEEDLHGRIRSGRGEGQASEDELILRTMDEGGECGDST